MKRLFDEINLLFHLKTFRFFREQNNHNSRIVFNYILLKILITNAMWCKILNAISRKHFLYSLFLKGIVAIEPQLYFLGLVGL